MPANEPAIKPSEKKADVIVSTLMVPATADLTLVLAAQDSAAFGSMWFDDFTTPLVRPDRQEAYSVATFDAERGRVERRIPLKGGSSYFLLAQIASVGGGAQLMLKLESNGKEVYRRYKKFAPTAEQGLALGVNIFAVHAN